MFTKRLISGYNFNERLSDEEVKKQSAIFAENKLLIDLIDSVSQMVVILNKERQVVYANKPYYDFCGFANLDSILGVRSGEALNCIHADTSPEGCNTSDFCRTCGAAIAISESQLGEKSTKECRIATNNNETLDLLVTATPFEFEKEMLTVFTITDMGDKKRKEALERIFFHDILNSASGILGLTSVLNEFEDPDEIIEITSTIKDAAEKLVDEIQMQHQIIAAERGDLKPAIIEIDSLSFLTQLKEIYSLPELLGDKTILIDEKAERVIVKSDPVLLRRILGNMIKNALEYHNPGDRISLSCRRNKELTVFSVHNSAYIEQDIQFQLFKRSFSTKGTGRGLGTYSMKLLGEKYLKGKVWFESTKEKGTTFFIEL